MNYKLEGALKRNKKSFIVFGVLWLIMAIVLVPSFAYSSHMAGLEGTMDIGKFIEVFVTSITDPLGTLGRIFSENVVETYFSTLLITTIVFSVFFFIGFAKAAPKNEYTDIEHGSSDWSQKGEQFQVLNRKQGIVLAEGNYLPVDKRGNVNVLVVGRFRFW